MKDKIKERLQNLYNKCGEHDPLKTYYRGRLKQHEETLKEVEKIIDRILKDMFANNIIEDELNKLKEQLGLIKENEN